MLLPAEDNKLAATKNTKCNDYQNERRNKENVRLTNSSALPLQLHAPQTASMPASYPRGETTDLDLGFKSLLIPPPNRVWA